jgi:hypothetical protein
MIDQAAAMYIFPARCWSYLLLVWAALASIAAADTARRVENGLEAIYDFEEGAGTVVHDRSRTDQPLHLQIESPQTARWQKGALVISGATKIASAAPAKRIVDAIQRSGSLTIEAWVKPENSEQNGPARIATLSADPSHRNFTLGQDGNHYDVRLRTSQTNENGIPSLASQDGTLAAELTHVAYTREAGAKATIYVNGKARAQAQVAGDLANWSGDFRLALANELTGERPWRGELHLVAIYSRALTIDEIGQNLAAGANVAAVDYAALLPPAAERRVDFVADVQPILREHCFECHAQGNEEGGLNLGIQSRALEGGEGGPVLLRGNSAQSRLIHLVAGIEKDSIMPPKENDPLSKEQIGILRAWIDQGLAWPKDADVLDPRLERARTHWAFQPLRAVDPPATSSADWIRTPIDQFILASLESKGLAPSPPADASRLVRRIAFDVAGLPPTPEEVAAFRAAAETDRQAAVGALVDRLLESRHYGERWGRHWLDVARYADSDGYESDADRPHAYQFRDFVIRALNDDLPFDTFVRWQLAGDEIEPDNPQAVAATGFLTAGPITILPPTHLEEERLRNRYNELDDILSTTGTALLGLTLGCARCHDHKYDAISSREYYRLMSAVHGGDRQVAKLPSDGSEALTFRDLGSEPRPTWLFARGDFYDRDQPVQLGFLEVLSRDRTAGDYWSEARRDSPRADTTYQRKALAAWTTDVEHGAGALAARVIVNRVWQHHFGEGLVRTVSDFGVRSLEPTHPELLEWLAHDFAAHGWKLKRLHRMILTSAAYQQSSAHDAEKAKLDPDNRLLWRQQPQRLEAEIIRDAMLAAGGTLNLEPFGPAFKPPISTEAMVARNTKSPYPADTRDDATTRRRSVYMFHKRVVPYPLLLAFDRPDAQQACGRREHTTVAPQALALLNDGFVRARAVDFANRLAGEGDDDRRLVERAFEIAIARQPTASELSASQDFLKAQIQRRQTRETGKPAAEVRLAAAADFCQAIFGLNEFLYID